MYRFLLKIVNRVPPSASACVFAYVAFGPTSGEIFNYRSLTRIQFLNKLKNLSVTPHLHIYNLFIHRRVIQVKKKEFELSNALLICVGWYDQQDRTDAEIWNKFKKSICISLNAHWACVVFCRFFLNDNIIFEVFYQRTTINDIF